MIDILKMEDILTIVMFNTIDPFVYNKLARLNKNLNKLSFLVNAKRKSQFIKNIKFSDSNISKNYYVLHNNDNIIRREGPYQIFHKGIIHKTCNYKCGKKEGIEIRFNESGQKFSEVSYIDGKEDGILTYFDRAGIIHSIVTFKDGEPDGLCQSWHHYPKQIFEKKFYKNGIQVGLEQVFLPDGSRWEECIIDNNGNRKVIYKHPNNEF